MYPPFPMDRAGTTAGRFLRSLPVNALINTVIAVMLTGIGFSGGFVAILINAQCIGFSIYLLLLSVRHPPLQKGEGADRPDQVGRGETTNEDPCAAVSHRGALRRWLGRFCSGRRSPRGEYFSRGVAEGKVGFEMRRVG